MFIVNAYHLSPSRRRRILIAITLLIFFLIIFEWSFNKYTSKNLRKAGSVAKGNKNVKVTKVISKPRGQLLLSNTVKFTSPIESLNDYTEAEYENIQTGASQLVDECLLQEPSFIYWDGANVNKRLEEDFRKLDPLLIIGILSGYLPMEQPLSSDFAEVESALRDLIRTKLHGAVDHDFNHEAVIDYLMQHGFEISDSLKYLGLQCFPILINVPTETRNKGMCLDASFYAIAFQGAITSGRQLPFWDMLCPDSIHLTLRSDNQNSISWNKPSWSTIDLEEKILHSSKPMSWNADMILARSQEEHRVASKFIEDRGRESISINLGMTSLDYSTINRHMNLSKSWKDFALISEKNNAKSIEMAIQIWETQSKYPTLTFTSKKYQNISTPDNIVNSLDGDALSKAKIQTGVHFGMSRNDSFGHNINELRALGSLIISVDHSPVNEMITWENGVLIEPESNTQTYDYVFSEYDIKATNIDINGINTAIEKVLAMPESMRQKMGEKSRQLYIKEFHSFFNKSHLEVKPYLLAPSRLPSPAKFPLLKQYSRNRVSSVYIGDPNLWFRSDFTSLRLIRDEYTNQEQWNLMWPDSIYQMKSGSPITRFVQGHVISGRIIRDWGSPTGEVGIKFKGDGCMKIQDIGAPFFATGNIHNNIFNMIAVGVRFLLTDQSGLPQIIFHQGGVVHGLDIYLIDNRLKIQARDDDWVINCDLGFIEPLTMMGLFFQMDSTLTHIEVILNQQDLSSTCIVDSYNIEKEQYRLTTLSSGGRSIGCVLGSMPLLVDSDLIQLREGGGNFKGFLFDIILWDKLKLLSSSKQRNIWRAWGFL